MTTAKEKAVAFPTERLVWLAKTHRARLRQIAAWRQQMVRLRRHPNIFCIKRLYPR